MAPECLLSARRVAVLGLNPRAWGQWSLHRFHPRSLKCFPSLSSSRPLPEPAGPTSPGEADGARRAERVCWERKRRAPGGGQRRAPRSGGGDWVRGPTAASVQNRPDTSAQQG